MSTARAPPAPRLLQKIMKLTTALLHNSPRPPPGSYSQSVCVRRKLTDVAAVRSTATRARLRPVSAVRDEFRLRHPTTTATICVCFQRLTEGEGTELFRVGGTAPRVASVVVPVRSCPGGTTCSPPVCRSRSEAAGTRPLSRAP